MLTVRQRIIVLLEQETLEVRDLSKRLGIKEKEALEHLQHIERTVHPGRIAMEPALCNECGFSFKKRRRFNTPSRCPVCRSESISPPRLRIVRPD